MVICLEQDADLHMAQLMPLPFTVSCFSKIQIGSTFLVPAHTGIRGKRAVKWMCVCVVRHERALRLSTETIFISSVRLSDAVNRRAAVDVDAVVLADCWTVDM